MVITPEVVLLGKMFSECYDEVKADPLNLPAALFAQAQHLKSDEFTKLGLPVPILSSINEDLQASCIAKTTMHCVLRETQRLLEHLLWYQSYSI